MLLPTLMTVHLIFLGSSLTYGEIVQDVFVGQEIVLKCQYTPAQNSTLFWIRTNRAGHDNVAIGDTSFGPGYTVDDSPSEGKYDLRIEKADYDRDNGMYECQLKQDGTGHKLHSSGIQLVVLIPPQAPVIHPTLPTLTEGNQANLTCSSLGGSPSPRIYWYRKGSPGRLESRYIEGETKDKATIAVLSIVPRKEDDHQTYRCRVWNRAWEEDDFLETSTSINVDYFPRITIGPENPVSVEKGGTAELFCKVDSKPVVDHVRWVRHGHFIAQTLKHVIPRVSLLDAGLYNCSADNKLGQVGSAEAELDVLYGPQVSLPFLKEADMNEDIKVVCKTEANPGVSSIVWTKEGDKDFLQKGSILHLPGSHKASVRNGRYTCSATNYVHPTGGEKQMRKGNATVTVLVRHAPGNATITPDNPIGVEGEAVRLECGASPAGHPKPTYKWWKEGSQVVIASSKQLTIHLSSLKHMGKYFCQPSNGFGKGTTAETFLEIYQKPKIELPLRNEVVKKTGDTGFEATCAAVAKPKPQVSWFKDGVEIDSSITNLYQISVNEHQMNNNKTFNVVSRLVFLGPERESTGKLTPSDSGHYSCRFKNQAGVKETKMLLRMEHAPIVKHVLNRVAADKGESVSLVCRMQAYPSPKFSWSKKTSNLRKYNESVNDFGNDMYEGVLHIDHIKGSSYGEYTCKAINKMGVQRTLIKLEEKGKPDVPKNVMVGEKSPFSIYLIWDEGFNGGYDDTTFNVEYKKIGDSSLKHVDCGRKNPCNITGLVQFTQYQFKVQSVNIRGASKWTREISVTTQVDVSKIPQPKEVYFATTSNIAEFKVQSYPLHLAVQVELKNDKTWVLYDRVGMDTIHGSYMQINIDGNVSDLRVRFCLVINEDLCGAYGIAKTVEELAPKDHTLEKPWLIALLVLAGLMSIAVLVCVAKLVLTCCRKSKRTKFRKKDFTEPVLSPSHSYGYDFMVSNRVTLGKQMSESPVMIKTQYEYTKPTMIEEDQFYDDSYTNSSTLPKYMQQYPHEDYSKSGNTLQKQQFPNQYQLGQQMPNQYQFGYNAFSQFPHLEEEYMNGQSRPYFKNGDQYDLPNKSQQKLGSDYNSHGDDTGVQDHYSEQNISEGLGSNQEMSSNAGMSFTSHPGVSLHNGSSFLDGVPPPEGYSTVQSTPSRRVIREIIV